MRKSKKSIFLFHFSSSEGDFSKEFLTKLLIEGIKENSPFFGFSKLFVQTSEDCKSRHLKFVSEKESFEEHMSVGVRFLNDLLHLESVVFLTTKKLP